jgi:hypothetical protein
MIPFPVGRAHTILLLGKVVKEEAAKCTERADHLRRMAIGTIGSGGGIDAVLMTRALERTAI